MTSSPEYIEKLRDDLADIHRRAREAPTKEEHDYWMWLSDAAAADLHFATRPEGAWKVEVAIGVAVFALPLAFFVWMILAA
jgi:hypothetical protein